MRVYDLYIDQSQCSHIHLQ